ncbi:MAG: hypothetical protein ACTS2F_11005 [Thainema sp.]
MSCGGFGGCGFATGASRGSTVDTKPWSQMTDGERVFSMLMTLLFFTFLIGGLAAVANAETAPHQALSNRVQVTE